MTFGLVGVAADGFDGEHSDDVLIFFSAVFGVKHTSHPAGLEEWRLFVGKEDKSQCFVDPPQADKFLAGESASKGKRCCDG